MTTNIYTKTDEAPALATYSFLPIIQAFAGAAGVEVDIGVQPVEKDVAHVQHVAVGEEHDTVAVRVAARVMGDDMSVKRQDAVLRWFEDNPVGALRSGTWGLKTMVFMGYYGQPETNASVGYQPGLEDPDGAHA